MATQTRLPVIDADAHVIETERTWDYLEPSEQRFQSRYGQGSRLLLYCRSQPYTLRERYRHRCSPGVKRFVILAHRPWRVQNNNA